MTTAELYCKGSRVWIRDPTEVWKGAELVTDFKGRQITVKFEDDDEKEVTIPVKSEDELPPLRNPEILVGENDLTALSYLHEPAVLYNLQVRFIQNQAIYTYCGIVLVAINPYEQLSLYGNDIIHAYSGRNVGEMDPHIFAVAEEAYKRMSRFEKNQSIIVSGESGAGKTVSAKYAMRYFATVGGSAAETQIEKKVLASNPIMEAIGNAKTTRNDNSSRFGKYIEIGFSNQHHIVGAHMRTYLLEKSRVVFQAPEERNYHIFYQLCTVSDQPEFKHLRLKHQDNFYFTNQGNSPLVDTIDDAETFEETREAFELLGFSQDQQMMVFQIMAAVLHFGNVEISGVGAEGSKVQPNDESLPVVAELLGIDYDQIRKWLCNRKIHTVGEVLTKNLTKVQALFARDALAKHIYAQLFNWIVRKINKALHTNIRQHNFIGVLDIYGFEMFEINSFEQFCINYANEKLQQQFTQHVFKLEQEEYVREKIEWSFIDFYDNQPCIDLIEGKLGLYNLLDEECMMPKGSDENWCNKLYKQHLKHPHFSKPRMGNSAFIIHHFADKVEYQSDSGFVEKNRDTVIEEHLNILRASQYALVAELFKVEGDSSSAQSKGATARSGRGSVRSMAGPTLKGQKHTKKSVGSQFRESLAELMKTLNATEPHYVRCIKPNDGKAAFVFEPRRAVEQLRACGVLETIRISAAGYPSRWTYPEFAVRYRVLMKQKDVNKSDYKHTCEAVLNRYINDPDKFQFGKTKIFFRAGQVAYLEKLRADKLRRCCVLIQTTVRCWVQRKKYLRKRGAAIVIQAYARGLSARRLAKFLRRSQAATTVQRYWRGHSQRQKYLQVRQAAITVQAYARGLFSRRVFRILHNNAKALLIQRHVRGWLARAKYRKTRKSLVFLQCCVRRMFARRELKKLKIEARSVEHYKKHQKGMENKIIELQQKINEMNQDKVKEKQKDVVIEKLEKEVKVMKEGEGKKVVMTNRIKELEEELKRVLQELATTRQEKKFVEEEMVTFQSQQKQVVELLRSDNLKIQQELDGTREKLDIAEKNMEETLRDQKEQLLSEIEEERAHHQNLLQDFSRLEQRYENLKEELEIQQHQQRQVAAIDHRRTPSAVSSELEVPLDSGYNTVASRHAPDEDLDRELEELGEEKASMDISLFVKLQNRLKDSERQRSRLQRELEGRSLSPDSEVEKELQVARIKNASYEEEVAKLKLSLESMRNSLVQGAVNGEGGDDGASSAISMLNDQIKALTDENDKHRGEIVQLKSNLLNIKEDRVKGGIDSSVNTDASLFSSDPEMMNEDGELQMAFHSQRQTIRLLEAQLQAERKNFTIQESELKSAMGALKKDNNRQQKIISQTLHLTPEARDSASLEHEISRLTGENLTLMEHSEQMEKQIKKLKKQLKLALKKIASDGGDMNESLEAPTPRDGGYYSETAHVLYMKDRHFTGILEYKPEDESRLIRNLIIDLKPRIAENQLPGLPAYIIFMCIRHADYINDDMKVKSLLSGVINGIKKAVKKRSDDFEGVSFWLANVCRLMHTLKQYSGEENFTKQNTPEQNQHCLKNFDLSEYRQVMNDLCIHIYQSLIRIIEGKLQPIIVPGMLEHEGIAGVTSTKPMGLRGRTSSVNTDEVVESRSITIDTIIKQLNIFLTILNSKSMDPQLIKQIFRQVFYLVTAITLNNLLLRKEMCHWSKGMQIRYNITELEEWLRNSHLHDSGAVEAMEPLVQVSQLLQVHKKTDQDVESICDLCTKLSSQQIIKILNLYTPVNEFETRVEVPFIRKVQERLRERTNETNKLLIDTKYSFSVMFPYNPSSILLNEVTIPGSFDLDFLNKI